MKIRGVGGEDDEGDEHAHAAQAPQVQDLISPSLFDVMGALTVMGDKFERFQEQVWARFDTLTEQIAFVDRKVSIGRKYNEPQVYPSQSSEATQSLTHARSVHLASFHFASVYLTFIIFHPLFDFLDNDKGGESIVRTDMCFVFYV